MSRLAASSAGARFIGTKKPFSNFDYVDTNFAGCLTARRLFTLARARGFKSFVQEIVPAADAVEAENQELRAHFPAYKSSEVVRVTFWKKLIRNEADLKVARSDDLVGYVILKKDSVDGKVATWHVFESVMSGYPHPHNYIPRLLTLDVEACGHRFKMSGVPYSQQNGLNKVCAQVALRSLCSVYLNRPDITYTEINEAASKAVPVQYPCVGLGTKQIEAVLKHFKMPFYSIFFPAQKKKKRGRNGMTYQKLLYNGVEAGAGALIGFSMSGRKAKSAAAGHIIPVFGHTFNEDTWAPVADGAYFKIGDNIRYIPSEAWTSSFLCHDDNFGSNFCLPKAFVEKKKATYIVSLRPRGFSYTGFEAEIIASELFYSILPQVPMPNLKNRWMERLNEYVQEQKLILRTIPNTTQDYAVHLRKLKDWHGNKEVKKAVDFLISRLPKKFWVVEVSIPDLFSTNLRKLGEIILSAKSGPTDDLKQFVFGRLPGLYVFLQKLDGRGHPHFQFFTSNLKGHTPLQLLRAPTDN